MSKQTPTPLPPKLGKWIDEELDRISSVPTGYGRLPTSRIVLGKLPTATWAAMFAELYTDPEKQLEVMDPFEPLIPKSNMKEDQLEAEMLVKAMEMMQWNARQQSRRNQGLPEENIKLTAPGWQRYEKGFTVQEVIDYLSFSPATSTRF